jgi:hypothetical protein
MGISGSRYRIAPCFMQIALYMALLTSWAAILLLACRTNSFSQRLLKDSAADGKVPAVARVSNPPPGALPTENDPTHSQQMRKSLAISRWQQAAQKVSKTDTLSLVVLTTVLQEAALQQRNDDHSVCDNPATDVAEAEAGDVTEGGAGAGASLNIELIGRVCRGTTPVIPETF